MLALDGLYVEGAGGCPEFHPLPAPEDAEVFHLTKLVSRRIQRLVERRYGDLNSENGGLTQDEAGLAGLYAASLRGRIASGPNAGRRVARLAPISHRVL